MATDRSLIVLRALCNWTQGRTFAWPAGNRMLTISSYNGDTPEAQITILLHELGHIIGRLPEDHDSWDGRSLRNTSEVSRHCKSETRAAAHYRPRGSIKAHNPGVSITASLRAQTEPFVLFFFENGRNEDCNI